VDDDAARAALEALRAARGDDYALLSRVIGRNAAYIQQYVKRGTPRRLAERDRRALAAFYGVPDAVLGGPADAAARSALIHLPRLDVAASAGPGSLGEERPGGRIGLDAAWLREIAPNGTAHLSAIRVAGDSMVPTLADGDEIIVDSAPRAQPLADGIWVLRRDDALLVKRLARDPASGHITIISDNPAYPPSGPHPPAALSVIGRVIWSGGRVG
jgi:phage repressor protein C with HTH and peptisase S24 domain